MFTRTIPDAAHVRFPQRAGLVVSLPLLVTMGITSPAFADRSFEQPRTQYFEILGSRSVYRDGWKVTTDHVISGAGAESELLEGSRDYDADHWNLFDLRRDFSESTDLSAEEPQLVESMIATWWEEAERNSVLPLVQGSFADMINASQEADSDGEPRTAFVYRPHPAPVHEDFCPNFAGGFSLTAEFDNWRRVRDSDGDITGVPGVTMGAMSAWP